MISPLPGCTTTKPGSATFPLPGIGAEVVDDDAQLVTHGGGYLTLTQPWPGMLRGIWGDPERYHDTYWSRFEGRYFAGDGCKLDDDGYLWLLGRVDDVMNVSGHRISTAEVESALVSHPSVAEAAVVGANDNTTGQAIIAYVTLRGGLEVPADVLRNHVAHEIGAIAKPKTIFFTPDLPKTRSGKIMRRLLRDVAEGRNLGDTTTLGRRQRGQRAAASRRGGTDRGLIRPAFVLKNRRTTADTSFVAIDETDLPDSAVGAAERRDRRRRRRIALFASMTSACGLDSPLFHRDPAWSAAQAPQLRELTWEHVVRPNQQALTHESDEPTADRRSRRPGRSGGRTRRDAVGDAGRDCTLDAVHRVAVAERSVGPPSMRARRRATADQLPVESTDL